MVVPVGMNYQCSAQCLLTSPKSCEHHLVSRHCRSDQHSCLHIPHNKQLKFTEESQFEIFSEAGTLCCFIHLDMLTLDFTMCMSIVQSPVAAEV